MAQTESSISRRDLLRKGAVAGAVAWTAPVVLSSPAFAATGKCSGSKPCTTFYYVKYDGTCSSSTTGHDNSVGCKDLPIPSSFATCGPGPAPSYADGCSLVKNASFSNGIAEILLPVGAIPIALRIKPSTNCVIYELPTLSSNPNSPTPVTAHSSAGSNPCSNATAYLQPVTVQGKDYLKFKFSATCTHAISHFSMLFCL